MIKFNKKLYSKNALMKTCYKFIDNAYIHLDSDNDYYYVSICGKNNETNEIYLEKEFSNFLIEQTNREIVFEQTKNIRQILYARSMASTIIYEDTSMEINTDIDDDTAMKDWFSNE